MSLSEFDDLINDEQLLDICLTLACETGNRHRAMEGPAGLIITARAVSELAKTKDEFSQNEITAKVSEMLLDKDLEIMTNNGIFEVDISDKGPRYLVTDKGKEVFSRYIESHEHD